MTPDEKQDFENAKAEARLKLVTMRQSQAYFITGAVGAPVVSWLMGSESYWITAIVVIVLTAATISTQILHYHITKLLEAQDEPTPTQETPPR